MTLKVILADLAHTHSVCDTSLTVPLGIGYVKAYAKHVLGNAIDISLFKHPENFLQEVNNQKPHIVGLSNYGWNENLNLSIGHYVRKILPNALIIGGGPNIDASPIKKINFLKKHNYLNYLAIDGGEEVFTELAEWYLSGTCDINKLPQNLAWLDNDGLHETQERALKKIIDHLPSPYLSGYLDEFLTRNMIPLFETNRGCPFKCTFCAWGSASKDLVRRIDLDQALAEITYVGQKSKSRSWIFCDANFGILQRDIEIAKAIRSVHESQGFPATCHIWLAKNVTERNLAIADILGDMIEPVMAVQSLDDEVLKNIKRDNISLSTYAEYQQKFNKIGSRTYSDVIVPLPAESVQSHLDGLRMLTNLNVDVIQNHNMRLLAGAEINSDETRRDYKFQTKYRLIHGDAGEYKAPDGHIIRTFEYEESLRSTSTISEVEMFWLRKLHFLINFCWNIETYRPLLKLGHLYGTNPIDVLTELVDSEGLKDFFLKFDSYSRDEWFNTPKDIEDYFSKEANWSKLINLEFDKLNILFGILVFKDYKSVFDQSILQILKNRTKIPCDILNESAKITFSLFPSLNESSLTESLEIASNLNQLNSASTSKFALSQSSIKIDLEESSKRKLLKLTISESQGLTMSKILDTQNLTLRDLRLICSDNFNISAAFDRQTSPALSKNIKIKSLEFK